VTEEKIAEAIVCGPEPERFVDAIRKAERTGYTHVCLHQVGPEQEAFMRFCMLVWEVRPDTGHRVGDPT
jgi:coenzyme F420-dependent glucose-6-phosphate dehydrogenase